MFRNICFRICAAVLACAGGAGVVPASAQTQLTLGPPPESFYPEVRGFLEQLASVYNASQNDVSVVVAADNPDFGSDPITREMLGDIVFLAGARFGEPSTLAAYADAGFLAPLDDFVNAAAFNRGDYLGNLWDVATFNGQVYGVPLIARAWAVGVNPDYCDVQAVTNVLGAWPSLLEFMMSSQIDSNGDGEADSLTSHTTKDPYFMWEILYLTFGGDPNNPASFTAQSAAWQAAAVETSQMVAEHPELFTPEATTHRRFEMFSNPLQFVHNDAMDPGALPLLRRRNPNWIALPPPGGGRIPNLDVTVAAITTADPARVAAAWGFLAWLSSAETMASVYPAADLVPLRHSVVQSLDNATLETFAAALNRTVFQKPCVTEHADVVELKQTLRSLMNEE